MKRAVLFLLAVFMYAGLYANDVYSGSWHRMADPVKVRERGINFYVFPNGTFDFNALGNHYQNAGYAAVRIERDQFGKIRRVGNVYINYNRHGQVSRIGNIFIKYNHRGLVSRVGHKYLRYNRHGYYVVKRHRPHRSYHPGYVYNSGFEFDVTFNSPFFADNTYGYGVGVYNYDNDYDDYEYNDGGDAGYYHRPSRKSGKSVKSKTPKNRRK